MENLIFRETLQKDIEQTFSVRASTRQNPVSISQLAEWGFTPESTWNKYSTGAICGWVCEDKGNIAGFCSGDLATGEVIVLAVLPQYEGCGIGKRLLSLLTHSLHRSGCSSLWLSASPNPEIRAHGFYRANGWRPNGRVLENGDEILVYIRPI
jgi:ribosomal protein S18 acetylase RimI-like enzyme